MKAILNYKNLIMLFCFFAGIAVIIAIYTTIPVANILYTNEDEQNITDEIETMYNSRNAAFISGNLNSLKPMFDTDQKYGQWSLEHEVRRVKYLKDWAKLRGIRFINVESYIRIKKIFNKTFRPRLALEESYKFDYIYTNAPTPVINSFGVGIRHTLTLEKKNSHYQIYSDWYTDCFEDAMGAYSGEIHDETVFSDYEKTTETYSSGSAASKPYYNRQKAVEYADKYCGAPWGSGNNYKYNKSYSDYNGIGGDCTNFASQVIGSPEGGGLPQDGTWHCSLSKYARCQGTRAWVNVDGLLSYLLYSGKGSQIKRGNFKDLTEPTQSLPKGAISKIIPGDLICYIKKGNPDHFAIVTAIDSNGYPLVNSHTTDRYHVPWDLGWGDKKITFSLIHING